MSTSNIHSCNKSKHNSGFFLGQQFFIVLINNYIYFTSVQNMVYTDAAMTR